MKSGALLEFGMAEPQPILGKAKDSANEGRTIKIV